MNEFKFEIGDIVHCGARVFIIKEIGDRTVKSIWGDFSFDEIQPIKIGSGYDSDITLSSHIPIMASCVESNGPIPIHRNYHFLQYEIDGVKIVDVVDDNHIEYVHELQKWLKINMPDEYLDI